MSDKERFPLDVATKTAQAIVSELRPYCERIEVAGSIRRGKPDVGDIEIVFVPLMEDVKASGDLFERTERVNYAENAIAQMVRSGMLAPRLNALGHQTVGPKNKLMRAQSGIPVDLFTATEENWFNYLVCRTGPAALNQTIATAAQLRGWKWTPYGPGYQGPEGEIHRCASEEDVFHFIGMPYKAPNEREE